MSNESSLPGTSRTRSRRTLVLLLLVMSAPFVASYALYFSKIRPDSSVNYGELLKVKTLSGNGLNLSDDTIFRIRDLRGKWALISVDSGACDEYCRKKLYYMRQARLVQNAERDRIERVWLVDDPETPAVGAGDEFEGVWRIRATDGGMLEQFPADVTPHDHIYVVDPIGNLMMRFPRNPDPALMAKDIKRLLKVSQLEHALGTDMKH
ncbi:hypothetical protein [Nitrosovibrio sp. Nv17]|uniref:SCO family protein n=1 Tax=Nitrosovibrio sp. Nv17 TaxID=1855339 RepID=UPI0021012FC6|nr:hypothetical protein [Nitrosovibrio sp. Nv17]